MTERIEAQVERFAPGFRERILARSAMGPAEFEAHNPNYVGGDINGGAADLRQLLARPVARVSPYRTPLPGCSSARRRRRPAAASTACAASTPPLRRSAARDQGSRVRRSEALLRRGVSLPSFRVASAAIPNSLPTWGAAGSCRRRL